jgi:hypothetical protein
MSAMVLRPLIWIPVWAATIMQTGFWTLKSRVYHRNPPLLHRHHFALKAVAMKTILHYTPLKKAH